jgi:predicted transcriptional regulator
MRWTRAGERKRCDTECEKTKAERMRLRRIIELVNGEVLTSCPDLDLEIAEGCGADLLSDVVASAKPGALLLTGLCTAQVVRTARVVDVAAIMFVSGKRPLEPVLAVARQNGMPLIRSTLSMFEACGRLYEAGLAPSFRNGSI